MKGFLPLPPGRIAAALPAQSRMRLTVQTLRCRPNKRLRFAKGGVRIVRPAPSPKEFSMTLQFPNRSRSFDETKQTVRFQGYDGMFEVRFLVEAAALMKSAGGRDVLEADCLHAFDTARTSIQDAALKVYTRNRRSMYTLTADDLK
jgi:hypothetical protein